jgi:hypothetical protein
VQLWDGLEHALIVRRFAGHSGRIQAVDVAPDGSVFITAEGSKILVWPGPARWADLMCAKLTSNVSRKEWREWISPDLPYVKQCPNLGVADDDRTANR